MNYVTETITPEKAQSYLQTSKGNRPISDKQIRLYAEEMKSGRWQLNGMCIIFDDDGVLIDGHHRLMAVVRAGIPVQFDVCRGARNEAFATYDCGYHRQTGHLLAIAGAENYNIVASIVTANDRLKRNGRLYGNNKANSKCSNSFYFDEYMKDRDGFEKVAKMFNHLKRRCNILNVSWAGGIYYYLTHDGGYSEEEVYPFFDELYSLDSGKIVSCDLLRRTITKTAMEGKRLQYEVLWAYIVKAWNFYVDGIEPKYLKYQSNEELPTLKLKNKQQ